MKITPSMRNNEGMSSEVVATYILKELGYEIIHSQGLEARKMHLGMKYSAWWGKVLRAKYKEVLGRHDSRANKNWLIGDILCKKDGIYYLFDVKLKFFQDDKNMNKFDVTDNEVLNYNKITKSKKVPVKILVNLKKDDGYYYGIFDWSDFKYSKNFDPTKSKHTTARLENGLDISKLTKFKNKKKYKFEKYLDYATIAKYTGERYRPDDVQYYAWKIDKK